MIWLTWAAAGAGLVCVRQFFHDVRVRARLSWLAQALFCTGVVVLQVKDMPEDLAILLLFKIVLTGAAASIVWFIWRYSRMEHWWRHSLGKTVVIKSILLLAVLLVSIVSLFFKFNRETSHLAAWVDLGIFAAMAPVMIWRTEVWQRIHDDTGSDDVQGRTAPPV